MYEQQIAKAKEKYAELRQKMTDFISEERMKELLQDPPSGLDINLYIPLEMSEEEINQYLMKHFHFDIDLDFESDVYLNIYYNSSLRSWMGTCLESIADGDSVLSLHLNPQSYFEGWEEYTIPLLVCSSEISFV